MAAEWVDRAGRRSRLFRGEPGRAVGRRPRGCRGGMGESLEGGGVARGGERARGSHRVIDCVLALRCALSRKISRVHKDRRCAPARPPPMPWERPAPRLILVRVPPCASRTGRGPVPSSNTPPIDARTRARSLVPRRARPAKWPALVRRYRSRTSRLAWGRLTSASVRILGGRGNAGAIRGNSS